MKRKIACSMLALSIALGATTTTYANPDLNNLQQRLNQHNEEKSAIEVEIDRLKADIDVAQEELAEIQSVLDDLNAEIEKVQKEIDAAEMRVIQRGESLNARVEAMYKSGSVGYIEVILASESVYDFFTRIDMVKNIVDHDNNVLRQLKKEKEIIDAQKADLEDKQAKAQNVKLELEEKSNELNELKAIQDGLLTQVNSNINQVQGEIETLRERLAREERERLAAIATNNQNAGTNVVNRSQNRLPAPAVSNERASIVLNSAYGFIGVPYVWGGTTPRGFDCSGLVQYVYREAGVNLPRVSQQQQNVGRQISTSELQPGDLVFWGRPATHVGIYVGGGRYLHAPRTGRNVSIDNLSHRPPTSASRVL